MNAPTIEEEKEREVRKMFSALRKGKGFSCIEFAEVLKTEFPKANAAGVSLAERPNESGVTYTSEARRFIKRQFGEPERQDHRRDKEHLTCWLPDRVKRAFVIAKEKRGFLTNHDYIIFLIMQDMARIEKAARSGGTEQGGEEKCINSIIAESEDLSNDR